MKTVDRKKEKGGGGGPGSVKRRRGSSSSSADKEREMSEQVEEQSWVEMAITGKGMPFWAWSLFLLSTIMYGTVFASPELDFKYNVAIWGVLLNGLTWLAPVDDLCSVLQTLGLLRVSIVKVIPYLPDIWEEKHHFLPRLPELVANIMKVLPHLDMILPNIHALAPHIDALLRNMDKLLPHADAMKDHIDDLLPLLNVRGWEDVIDHLEAVVPHISVIAPHAERLIPVIDPILPHIPILVKYIDNLAPQFDRTVDVLDRLLPFIPLLPIADQTGILYSKLACKTLPTVAKILPKQNMNSKKSIDNLPMEISSPIPSNITKSMSISIDCALIDEVSSLVLYRVRINGNYRDLRYSQLLRLHNDMYGEISTYSKMRLFPFPSKTYFGRSLSQNGVERRRISLENYYDRIALNSAVLTEESPSLRKFIRTFYVSHTGPLTL